MACNYGLTVGMVEAIASLEKAMEIENYNFLVIACSCHESVDIIKDVKQSERSRRQSLDNSLLSMHHKESATNLYYSKIE